MLFRRVMTAVVLNQKGGVIVVFAHVVLLEPNISANTTSGTPDKQRRVIHT